MLNALYYHVHVLLNFLRSYYVFFLFFLNLFIYFFLYNNLCTACTKDT